MSNSHRNSNRRPSPQSITKAKRRRSRKIGIIIADIQLILTLVLLGLIIMLNVLPTKYLIALIFILLFFVGYAFLSQMTKRYRTIGKIVSIFMSIALAFGSYYLIETNLMLSSISGVGTKIDEMQIVVIHEDPAETINDTIDYSYGINEIYDREKTSEVIERINKELDSQLNVMTYSGYYDLIESLFSGESQVIIINKAYREIIHETYPDFDERTRILGNYDVETTITTPKTEDIDLTREPFHVFISGIDTSGNIKSTGRSDVNIIATINPNTKQVLLTTTPRDYYIHFPNTGEQRDKLTHAGIYGVDVSMGALEKLYGINMEYFVRVNFTTLINMVDSLGGVTAYSEYSFSAGGYSFQKGYNEMDGKKALAFSRERSSFGAGDMQRGRNQMEVIKGIINKALSPAIITNYSSIMNNIGDSFQTNIPNNKISSLIKMQIDDMSRGKGEWNIISNNVIGKPANMVTYTGQRVRSVVLEDAESIMNAKEKIYATMDGDILTQN